MEFFSGWDLVTKENLEQNVIQNSSLFLKHVINLTAMLTGIKGDFQ